MAIRKLQVPSSSTIGTPEGSDVVLSFYNDIDKFASQTRELLEGDFTETAGIVIEEADDKDYPILRNIPFPIEITSVATKSSAGTCTATVKIGSTALGGTANSVSSTEQIQTHTSSNTGVVGDDVKATISSNSSAEMVEIFITYQRLLFV